jgi:hypothetical protein
MVHIVIGLNNKKYTEVRKLKQLTGAYSDSIAWLHYSFNVSNSKNLKPIMHYSNIKKYKKLQLEHVYML